jgi:alginate O-acetyltransferase complex protein AlgI
MLFHSYAFVFGVLPACYLGFLLAHRVGGWQVAYTFLAVASVALYAQWGVLLAALLMSSVVANYLAGEAILALRDSRRREAGWVLFGAIAANVILLAQCKYTNFFIDIANQLANSGISHINLIVPIGVSFFTFVQIAYLIEAYNGNVAAPGFTRYVLLVTFIPCVTAGPIVGQREIFDQMKDRKRRALDPIALASGGTLFAIGLFKKVVLADSIAPFADSIFNGAAAGLAVDPLTAWIGALCYALQLYFDFSGYSDMAVGIGCIFGLKLPLNFNSPFKTSSISDFWRSWHMTMTRFFTTYIYTPLAVRGMRRSLTHSYSTPRRFMATAGTPAIVTFLVAGVWHGAGWTFVVYGLIHGVAIAVNLGWRQFAKIELPWTLGWLLTMSVVVSGLVVFRSPDLMTCAHILSAMWTGGMANTSPMAPEALTVDLRTAAAMIMVLGSIVLLMPNSQQILHANWPSSDSQPESTSVEAGLIVWQPTMLRSVSIALLSIVAIASIGSTTSFLYYSF